MSYEDIFVPWNVITLFPVPRAGIFVVTVEQELEGQRSGRLLTGKNTYMA